MHPKCWKQHLGCFYFKLLLNTLLVGASKRGVEFKVDANGVLTNSSAFYSQNVLHVTQTFDADKVKPDIKNHCVIIMSTMV